MTFRKAGMEAWEQVCKRCARSKTGLLLVGVDQQLIQRRDRATGHSGTWFDWILAQLTAGTAVAQPRQAVQEGTGDPGLWWVVPSCLATTPVVKLMAPSVRLAGWGSF